MGHCLGGSHGTLWGELLCCADGPPEYVCEEDADDFCEDADDACEPEIADDEGQPLVAEPEEAPPTEPSEPPTRNTSRFLAFAPRVRNPTTQGSRHVTTCTRFVTRR